MKFAAYFRFAEIGIVSLVTCFLLGSFTALIVSPDSSNTLDGDGTYQILLVAAYGVILLCAVVKIRKINSLWSFNPWLWLLLAIALISPMWSQTPALSFRRSAAVLLTSFVGYYIGCNFTLDELNKLIRTIFTASLIASVVAVVVFPSIGISTGSVAGDWKGIFFHKNVLGSVCGIAILTFLFSKRFRRIPGLDLLLICLAAVLLICSDAKAPLVAMLGAFAAVPMIRSIRFNAGARASLVLSAASIVAVSAAGLYLFFPALTGLLGRSSDLTGRTVIWQVLLYDILKRPWMGYGYSGFWGGASSEAITVDLTAGWSPAYAHNGYLDLLLNVGIVGAILFVLALIRASRFAVRFSRVETSKLGLWPGVVLLYILLHNLAETTLFWQNSFEWLLFVAVATASFATVKKEKSAQNVARLTNQFQLCET